MFLRYRKFVEKQYEVECTQVLFQGGKFVCAQEDGTVLVLDPKNFIELCEVDWGLIYYGINI